MNIVIIEDEPLAADHLVGYVQRYDPKARIGACLHSAQSAIDWLREHPAPDLLLADIQLQDGDIFTVLDAVRLACPIIFATAYDRFVMDAFERSGIAYLLKPIGYEKFSAAMDKYHGLAKVFSSGSDALLAQLRAVLAGASTEPRYRDRLMIRRRDGIVLLPVVEISYVQVSDEIVCAFDDEGVEYPLRETLAQLEQILDPRRFFRIGRGVLIHVRSVVKLEPYGRDRLLVHMRGGATLTCSASRTAALRRWLQG